MLLIRVRMPNRPDSLGAVASALGVIGADINLVEIVEKRGAFEIDEFILDLPSGQTVESLLAACDSLRGVQVQWVRNYPRGGGIELDVELHRRMAANSARAAETLVTAAPLVFRAQWGLLLQGSTQLRVIFSTPGAPRLDVDSTQRLRPFDTMHRVLLEPGWLPGWDSHHAVVAPMSQERAIVIGRRGEPAFFGSELVRLTHLIGGTTTVVESDEPAFTTEPGELHRRPVAAPLYQRVDDEPRHGSPPPVG